MSSQILFLLLLVVLVAVAIPVAVYFAIERPEAGPPSPPVPKPSAEAVGLLKRWYADKHCVFCSRAIGAIGGEPRPGLLDRETHRALAWHDVAAADLPGVLDRYQPVCASCFTAEAFRSRYPDLVVDRAPTPLRDSAIH